MLGYYLIKLLMFIKTWQVSSTVNAAPLSPPAQFQT